MAWENEVSGGTYGAPRIQCALARSGVDVGVWARRIDAPQGLPMGGDLEYADSVTLGRALEGRRRL